MNKPMLLLAFLSLGFLTITGTVDPNNSAVWLSSTEQSFDILRTSVMFGLLVLMFTNPPRNVLLRLVIGLGTVGLISWSGYMTYQNVLMLFDGIALLAAGVTALIAVLEFEKDDEVTKQIVSPNLPADLRAQLTNR